MAAETWMPAGMPTTVDLLFAFVLVVVASVVEHFWFWPRFRGDVAAGDPRGRVRAYRRGVLGQWVFAAAAFAIWISYHRPFEALRLVPPTGWRLGLSVVLVLVMLALVVLQLWSVLRLSPERRVAARPKLGAVAFLLPHTLDEHRWFLALSTTAGFCEELLYRGYLAWLMTPWFGATGAMVAVVVLFGIGHAYQGRKGALRATIAGAVMAAVVLATNSLIPAMIIHAMIDASSGTLGYWLLHEPPPNTTADLRADVTADVTTDAKADVTTDITAVTA